MQLTLGITVEGLCEMVQDLRAEGFDPQRLILHRLDAQQLLEDIILTASSRDANAERDAHRSLLIVAGCDVQWHPHVERGACWVCGPDLVPIVRAA